MHSIFIADSFVQGSSIWNKKAMCLNKILEIKKSKKQSFTTAVSCLNNLLVVQQNKSMSKATIKPAIRTSEQEITFWGTEWPGDYIV